MPLLTLVFLVEVANAPKGDFPIWLNVVAVAVGFAILLGAWMLANRIRGRPLLARPESVGVFEVAVFVLAPPAIPLVVGGRGFLTVFAGLYFTVTAITDESYRKEFIGEILDETRRSLAVRAVYLAALGSGSNPRRSSTISST